MGKKNNAVHKRAGAMPTEQHSRSAKPFNLNSAKVVNVNRKQVLEAKKIIKQNMRHNEEVYLD